MTFNSGFRAKRANDTQGIVGPQSQFLQKTYPKPYITGYTISGSDDTALNPAGGQTVLINGGNFSSGVSAVVDGAQIGSVTLINSNQISFTTPAKASGSYTLIVYNPSSDAAAILVPGLIYSGIPTFTTPAGSIGSVYETKAINTSVVATSDSALTYAITSGSIPTGATFYANGVMTGTAPVDSGSTTYTFAVTATDAELQDTTRTFTLTVNTDVVTWNNPSSGATIVLDGSAYSTTLSATSAAGYNVSYTANALPTGLTLTGNTISGTPTVEGSTTTLLTATAATSNRSATNTITWTLSLGDTYWSYVTTLLSPTLPAMPFNDDASTNNFAVTINGDTRPYNFNPYTPGYYSNYFDAKTDYISIPATTALTTFTGDFTFEAWIYPNDTSITYWKFWDSRQSGATAQAMVIGLEPLASPVTGQGRLDYFNGAHNYGTGIVYYNQWSHIAFVRSGSTMTFYINGVAGGTSTVSGTQTGSATTNPVWIGTKDNGSASYGTTGYISNFRIVNGTAVYTGNFTPSTSPLTAITNTVLLACQSNRFIDNSTNNYTLTSSSTNISRFTPYTPNSSYSTYGSGYFDGNGDYLTVASNAAFGFGTGDFTIECWIYPTNAGAALQQIYDNRTATADTKVNFGVRTNTITYCVGSATLLTSAASSVVSNVWQHVAVVKSSGTTKIYINGTQSGPSYTDNYNFTSPAECVIATPGDSRGSSQYSFAGYISDIRVIKGQAVYTANFTLPTTPLTPTANTSLLTCQTNQPVNNNVFLDNSTNNFAITRAGNTTQGTFSPYGENWSNYFDGTGDMLTVPYNAGFSLTGDFTIELFVNYSAHGAYGGLICNATGGAGWSGWQILFNNANDTLLVEGNNSTLITSSSALPRNQWNHVALVRNGSSITLYFNGQSVGTATSSATFNSSTAVTRIGAERDGLIFVTGYISNARIVKGTALYTSNFTPSTTPLQAVSGTSLLTCQSPNIVDNSPNNYTITKAGDVSVQKFGPFAGTTLPTPYYSAYFDGTGDYLTTAGNTALDMGTGDFTIECFTISNGYGGSQYGRGLWALYPAGNYNSRILVRHSNAGQILGIYGWNGSSAYFGSSGTGGTINLTVGQWYHVAFVRQSGVFRLYIGGVQDIVVSNQTAITLAGSNCFDIGRCQDGSTPDWNGYISNFRAIKGTCLYPDGTTFTPPTSPLTSVSGTGVLTCGSNTFVDSSSNAIALTVSGTPAPRTATPFAMSYSTKQSYTPGVYGGSMYFGATSAYTTYSPASSDLFGTGDFTVECWVYTTVASVNICMASTTASTWQLLTYLNQLYWQENGTNLGGAGYGSVPLNAWTHLAVSRSGTTLRMFVNGVSVYAPTNSYNYSASPTTRVVGPNAGGSAPYYLSDFRIVKGTALYTSNFVPQNKPLTAVKNTTLLLNGTSAGVYDSSENVNFETVGDAKLSTTTVKFSGSTSIYFDGTGDYLYSPANPNFALGSGNFTVECWFYLSSSTSNQCLIDFRPGSTSTVGFFFGIVTSGYIQVWNNANIIYYNAGITTGTWYHVALVRNSTTMAVYLNGTSVATATNSTNFTDNICRIGSSISAVENLNGYLSDLRVTKGYARYTANFTPPTTPFNTK